MILNFKVNDTTHEINIDPSTANAKVNAAIAAHGAGYTTIYTDGPLSNGWLGAGYFIDTPNPTKKALETKVQTTTRRPTRCSKRQNLLSH